MRSCIHCGCTDSMACVTEFGPCRWVRTDPPECSACVEAFAVADRLEAAAADLAGGDGALCPASPEGRPAPHAPLYALGGCYCARCKEPLAA